MTSSFLSVALPGSRPAPRSRQIGGAVQQRGGQEEGERTGGEM
jgi:hypothetical protein